ncbi:MAG: helix-turn-helix transcriptional regulator [Lachnospiraceae bacterium]|nr:helix-turn-helix transcriptional regulator [Lachnospiraceae bacterium]
MEERQFGTIRIHLSELMKERDISKNRLSQRAEMQRTQLNHYCNNDISRLDIMVLAKLCTVLECGIGDLLEFVPAGSADKTNTAGEEQEI